MLILILSGTYAWYPLLALSVVLLFLFFGVFIATAFSAYKYREAKKRHQARQNQAQARRITIAKEGIWEAGTFFPLNGHDVVLEEVKLTHQPTILHFRRTKHFPGEETTPQSDTLRVPVPGRYENDAAHLLQQFRTEVIETQQRQMNPPEPD